MDGSILVFCLVGMMSENGWMERQLSFHKPRLSLMGPTYHPRPPLFSTVRPSLQRTASLSRRAGELRRHAEARSTPPHRGPMHVGAWRNKRRRRLTRTERYAPVPLIRRAGSVPHLWGQMGWSHPHPNTTNFWIDPPHPIPSLKPSTYLKVDNDQIRRRFHGSGYFILSVVLW